VAKATKWRAQVREQAAQLADWEVRPEVPENAPIGVDALKMLMIDAGRILGAVVCLGEFIDEDEEAQEGEGSSGHSPAEEASRYQQQISELQQQLSESKAAQHTAEARVAQLELQAKQRPSERTMLGPHAGGADGDESMRRQRSGRVNLVVPKGSFSLELPQEPL
jgi:hypothetical protein